jgi:hypothetical protein
MVAFMQAIFHPLHSDVLRVSAGIAEDIFFLVPHFLCHLLHVVDVSL